MNQLKLEILALSEENGQKQLEFEIHNFEYWNTYEQSFSNLDTAEQAAKVIYADIVCCSDLLKKDAKTRELIQQAEREAEKIVIKKTPLIYKFLPFLKPRLGTCHILWHETARILKEKHGIDWKSPQDRLPKAKFD